MSPDPNGADAVERAKGLILAASEDPQIRNSLFRSFAEDCRISERAFLLWNGCMRHSEKYRWPAGFSVKWKTSGYRGLVNAGGNGPPRTAFTVAGGDRKMFAAGALETLWGVGTSAASAALLA